MPNPWSVPSEESCAGSQLLCRANPRVGSVALSDRDGGQFAIRIGEAFGALDLKLVRLCKPITVHHDDPNELCSMRSPSQPDMGTNPRCGHLILNGCCRANTSITPFVYRRGL